MAQANQRTSVLQVVAETGHKDKHVHWADMEEVRKSLRMPPNGKPTEKNINLTEQKFEVLSQEALFNFRLRSLVKVIPIQRLTEEQRLRLFGTIDKILNFSDELLNSLEQLWQKDIYLVGIFELIKKFEKNFDIYIVHDSNQKDILNFYTKHKAENKEFSETFDQWQNCQENYSKMNFESYYNLPKERLISLTKTCEHVLSLMEKRNTELKNCQIAVKMLKKLSSKWEQSLPTENRNDSATLKTIANVVFSAEIQQIPLAISGRELKLEDELTLLKLSGSNVSKRSPRHLILFNDLLLITRRVKREERLSIVDYCYRKSLELKNIDDFLQLMQESSLTDSHDKLLTLKLHQNHEEKSAVMLFSCVDAATCTKWKKQLVKNIENNKPKQSVVLPVPDIVVHVDESADTSPLLVHPPVVLRNNPEDPFVNELKRKQEALKRDSRVPSEVMDDFDTIVEDAETDAFHIPRPQEGKTDRPSLAPPPIPAKPRKSSIEEPVTIKPSIATKIVHDQDGIIAFDNNLEYPPGMPVFPLLSAARWKVQDGEATLRCHIVDKKYSKTKTPLYIVLFNDVLFITKRKGNRSKVLTYGFRNLVDMTDVKEHPHLPTKLSSDRPGKFVMAIHFLENYKLVEETLIVSLTSAEQRDSWLKAIPSPPLVDDGGDRQFDPWDGPLVMAHTSYSPTGSTEPHQLRLTEKDKYQVTRRRKDGFYEGQRVSDGEMGLILIDCTQEVASQHLHAKEVRKSKRN